MLRNGLDYFDEDLFPDLFSVNDSGELHRNTIGHSNIGRKVKEIGNSKKSLMIVPTVTKENKKGIKMYINSQDQYIELNEKEYKALYYNLDRMNIPEISASIVALSIQCDLAERKTTTTTVSRIGKKIQEDDD
jgi:hypothetical protein